MARQEGHASKQWFLDDSMDLFVWTSSRGMIEKFQLAYRRDASEYALTWYEDGRVIRHLVDDGEQRPGRHKAAPILVPCREFPIREACEAFVQRARNIDGRVRDFVTEKLESLPAAGWRGWP